MRAPARLCPDMEHALVEQSGDSVTLCLEANVLTMEKFPFAFKLFSTFRLEGVTVHHDIRVENDGGEVMPFAFGYPAFLCPFDAAHKAEDYVLRFDAADAHRHRNRGGRRPCDGRDPCLF